MDHLADDILALSRMWMQAWIDKDQATLQRLLAPDFALVIGDAASHRFERPQWMALALGDYHGRKVEYDDVLVRQIVDDLVVMSSVMTVEADIAGEDRSGRLFLIDHWRRNGEGWQVCARFSSRVGDMEPSVRAMMER